MSLSKARVLEMQRSGQIQGVCWSRSNTVQINGFCELSEREESRIIVRFVA